MLQGMAIDQTATPTVSRPATEVIAATWACVRNGRLLVVRPAGQDAFYLPGGTPEPGETLAETAAREVVEETGIRLHPDALRPLVEVTAPAHGRPGAAVRLVCFTADSDEEPTPSAEIEQVDWFTSADVDRCAPAVRSVVRHLAAVSAIG